MVAWLPRSASRAFLDEPSLDPMDLTSPPAQNAPPAPVRITTRMSSDMRSLISSIAWSRSMRIRADNALRASGRLSVIVATPSLTSNSMSL